MTAPGRPAADPPAATEARGTPPTPVRPTSAARLAFAWALVGVPLAWGVYQVFLKSLDLFR